MAKLNKLFYALGTLIVLVVLTRVWFQWSIERLSMPWTEYENKIFLYDWVPMIIYCSILLVIALMSFYKKSIAFLLGAIALPLHIQSAIMTIAQIPQGTSYFWIKPQICAVLVVFAFIISLIGTGIWISRRILKQ